MLSLRTHRTSCLLLLTCSFSIAASAQLFAANLETDQLLEADDLFDSSKLLEVELELPEADWDSLRKQTRGGGGFAAIFAETISKPFTYFKADMTINGVQVSSVGIRKKGFIGSLDETRPSLKIKFSEYVKQQPVHGLDRLTLNNNKQDTALVSQLLSYKVFNDAGVHAPRCSLAKVTVNGTYLGIYSNVESFKKPFLAARYGDDSGNLYEGTVADFYPKTLGKIEAKADTTTAAKDPDVTRLSKLLASDEPLPMGEIEEIVDVDSFLKFWAVESLIGFWDGYTQNQNNYFVYDNPKDGKFYFMPWGADSCFDPGGSPFGNWGKGPQSAAISAEAMLANRLFYVDGMPDRYRTALEAVLKDAWDEDKLVDEVNRIEKLTKGLLHENQKGRGGRRGGWGRSPLTMDGVRDFINDRRDDIQSELDKWPVEVSSKPRKPTYSVKVGSASGSLQLKWSEKSRTKDAGEVSDFELTMEDEEVTLTEVTAKAHPMQMGGFGGWGRREWTPPATIVVSGVRESDDERITLTLMVDRKELVATKEEPLAVRGSLAIGQQRGFGFGFGGPSGKTLGGTLNLQKAGTKDGDAIEGTFQLNITEMRGWMAELRGGRRR